MSQHVEAIARLAGVGCQPAFDLKRHPESCVNPLHGIDMANGARENEVETAFRANRTPLPQCVHDDWREGNVTFASFGFWWADLHPLAGALPK
jgi:hypothetical protein